MKSKARDFPFVGYGLMLLSAISFYVALLAQGGVMQAIIVLKAAALLGIALSVLSAPRRIEARVAVRRKR